MTATPGDTGDPCILIAGAGPSGLLLAIALRRMGVASRLIDANAGPTDEARATVLRPRTLEILGQLGLFEVFRAAGVDMHGARIYEGGDRLVMESATDAVESPHPFNLSLPQSATERLLVAELARLGQTVERNTELMSATQDQEGVTAVLRHADRDDGTAEETVTCAWLVGADGAHSVARHALGLELEGTDDPLTFIVADLVVRGPLATDKFTVFHTSEHGMFLGLLPDGRCLFSGNLPPTAAAPAEGAVPTLAEIQSLLDDAGPGGLTVEDPAWMSYFHVHSRIAPRYSGGRIFLVGDAAHVQSPAGGQGMNTGMQDSWNLAWKLALVARGNASGDQTRRLLDSYDSERQFIGRTMLSLADQAHHKMFGAPDSLVTRTRQWVAGFLAEHHVIDTPRPTDDMTRIAYHHSPIVDNYRSELGDEAWRTGPRAGDRAPDGALIAGRDGTPVQLFAVIAETDPPSAGVRRRWRHRHRRALCRRGGGGLGRSDPSASGSSRRRGSGAGAVCLLRRRRRGAARALWRRQRRRLPGTARRLCCLAQSGTGRLGAARLFERALYPGSGVADPGSAKGGAHDRDRFRRSCHPDRRRRAEWPAAGGNAAPHGDRLPADRCQ